MHPVLPKSYKRYYPFRLATTSFIYPDDFVPNVRALAPFVDEIELLLFESRLPGLSKIGRLAKLQDEFDLRYNVHLPVDIDPAHFRETVRRKAVDVLKRAWERTAPLSPTTYTLHLPLEGPDRQAPDLGRWRRKAARSLHELQTCGMQLQHISIESLAYPLQYLDPILERLPVSICLDVGHLLLARSDPQAVFHRYRSRISIIHLHGIRNGCDHHSLAYLPKGTIASLVSILSDFSGTVSLEVFDYSALATSLESLCNWWRHPPQCPSPRSAHP